MDITDKSELITLTKAAAIVGIGRSNLKWWSDFEGLTTIRDERGRLHVRLAELGRFLAEREDARQRRTARAERRRAEAAARRERWLSQIAARHGLVRAE